MGFFGIDMDSVRIHRSYGFYKAFSLLIIVTVQIIIPNIATKNNLLAYNWESKTIT